MGTRCRSIVIILVSITGSIHIQKCIVGHCGDARAILSRNARPVTLTTDHVPTLESEHTRVLASCGTIENQMVSNFLGVSRSIRDLDVETGEKIRGVCFKPVVLEFDLRKEEDELVLVVTDGFWETFSNVDAIARALKL